MSAQKLDVLVVGGGQSGLALGYYLAKQGRRFTILDAGPRVGHVWRNRWDSLRLITPCPYNDLPGLRFPGRDWSFPHKDEVADYLERYAETFALPVQNGEKVLSVRPSASSEGYRVESSQGVYEAKAVVLATGAFQSPRTPTFASTAAPSVLQLHSSAYRNPSQIPEGDVLVVGCGNSGAGIAMELSPLRRVLLSLGRTASSPRTMLGRDLFWWAHTLGLTRVTVDSMLGKKLRDGPDGLIGLTTQDIAKRGARLMPRLLGFDGDRACFEDGSAHRVDTVVWATGLRPSYEVVKVPVLDERGAPVHRRGVTSARGLYFLGLKWQYRVDSSLLGGVGRDAAYLAEQIQSDLAGRERKTRVAQEGSIHV